MWKEVEMGDKNSSCKNYANLKQSARMPDIGLRVDAEHLVDGELKGNM